MVQCSVHGADISTLSALGIMFAGRQYDTLYLTDRFCKAFYTSSIWNKFQTPVNTEQVIQLTKTDILSVEDTTW